MITPIFATSALVPLGTTNTTTTTVIGGTILNNHTLDKIYEKYATSYIELMSNEELEVVLE